MPKNILLVSGGDTKYFNLLCELLNSIRNLPDGDRINLAFLDGGLKEKEINFFKKNNVNVVDPGWRHPIAEKKCKGRDFLKINIAKLHLDKIFPEYKIIIWIDGDAWLQSTSVIKLFELVALKKKLAIVSQATRLQENHISFKNAFFNFVKLKNILYKNAVRSGLSRSICLNLQGRPTLNAGAYGLHQSSGHWENFRYWQDIILRKGRLFTSDQLAMGLAIWQDNLSYEALPDICNYMGPWRWCKKRKIFVDYFAPYDPISVVHLAGQDKMRADPSTKITIMDMNDAPILKSLRFQGKS
ncbi:hypothetical protein OAL85_00890 [Methylophilaceae bacterium]|nr:hypothetical protein [Methylophilaceae bacterium]